MPPNNVETEILKSHKLAAMTIITITLFYFANRFAFDSSLSDNLPRITLITPLFSSSSIVTVSDSPPHPPPYSPEILHPQPSPSPPPPPEGIVGTGIVDENGQMSLEFEIGEVIDLEDDLEEEREREIERVRVKVGKFGECDKRMIYHVPCLDNAEGIGKLNSTENGENYERHCPEANKGMDCVIPRPKGYKIPIPWPQSRDEVWLSNVRHEGLLENEVDQNSVRIEGGKVIFPAGGSKSIPEMAKYLDTISQMVPDISFGQNTQVVLDVGGGIGSFGASLLERNVSALTIAPKDAHENQIQLALERGVPAMFSAFATRRLLYSSQAFDFIHCSECGVNWTHNDGILLLEVNRLLRAGGYFAWVTEPVHSQEEKVEQWKEMVDLTARICWELVKKEGNIAIWRKPSNNSCYISRDPNIQPPLCDIDDDPDNLWYVPIKACIARLPETESEYGANATWAVRLHNPPSRLQSIRIDSYMARKELFKAESKYWYEIVNIYVHVYRWKEFKSRSVMDMKAGFGGFAAALKDFEFDAWVMNVIPVSGFNTLPVIYDRGLLGVMHDWCEPFDTYPRTYDLVHAAGLFSIEQERCNISNIVLEIDRILRPSGHMYIHDKISVVSELEELAAAVGWWCIVHNTFEGAYANTRILICEKRL